MRKPLVTLFLAALLSGCGYKGALYLPSNGPEAQKPAAKPAPRPEEKKPDLS